MNSRSVMIYSNCPRLHTQTLILLNGFLSFEKQSNSFNMVRNEPHALHNLNDNNSNLYLYLFRNRLMIIIRE